MSQKNGLLAALRNGRRLGLALGPLLFAAIWLLDPIPGQTGASRLAAVAALMAVWWMTEAIPLAATALLPLALFPFLGIMRGGETAPLYINGTIFLFIGGFMIALAMERWRLHKRIALLIIQTIGGGPARIVLGFMVAAAGLSMWISNTATAIMMLPIGLAVITKIEERFGLERSRTFAIGLMLGIAYGCSIGGMATLVGTPPNLILTRIYQISFPEAAPIGFGLWLLMALPLSLLMLTAAWLLLTRFLFRASDDLRLDPTILAEERRELGPMSREERIVLVVFALTALLWVFRQPLSLGSLTIPGWSNLLPEPDSIDDGVIAIFMALLLFIMPAKAPDRDRILDVQVFREIPWHIVLLFGGGFALAKGFQVTGLTTAIGDRFSGLAAWPPILAVAVICCALTFLTELTSNTATTQMMLPVLAAMAAPMDVSPLMLMIPATLSASCAFMMPVATPPNAIVFGSGRVSIAEMVKAGIWLNLLGILVITLYFSLIGARLFGV